MKTRQREPKICCGGWGTRTPDAVTRYDLANRCITALPILQRIQRPGTSRQFAPEPPSAVSLVLTVATAEPSGEHGTRTRNGVTRDRFQGGFLTIRLLSIVAQGGIEPPTSSL